MSDATDRTDDERVVAEADDCACGDSACMYFDCSYPWCRSCGEHHRPPECSIDQDGYPLASCGCRWEDRLRDLPCPHYDD